VLGTVVVILQGMGGGGRDQVFGSFVAVKEKAEGDDVTLNFLLSLPSTSFALLLHHGRRVRKDPYAFPLRVLSMSSR
jgi:hypothetical protein